MRSFLASDEQHGPQTRPTREWLTTPPTNNIDAIRAGNLKLAERTLTEFESRSGTKEERALAELGKRGIQVGRLSRIAPFGLQQPDILDYLSSRHFNLEAADWQIYKAAFQARKRNGDAFKDFVRREYGAKINMPAVAVASKTIVRVPDDFAELGGLIRRLG